MSGRIIESFFFFFQAEDGIRDKLVTGVQTCALPISHQDEIANKFRTIERDLLRDHSADGEAKKVDLLQPQSVDERLGVLRHACERRGHFTSRAGDAGIVEDNDFALLGEAVEDGWVPVVQVASKVLIEDKRQPEPLVFNQHFTGNLDNWDPAVLDGLAKEREVIIFNNAGVASSRGEVPTTFAGMAKNAEAFIDALGLKQIDLLGFSIGGMIAQQITLDRPELVRQLILVGTAPRNHDAGNGQGHITPETAAIFGATYSPPENLWLKVFFTDSEKDRKSTL